ncbi:hypothetical protein [Halosolutus gelatinilyticus]|uniref:hypothetical protein n=1 Tax=Halosolutus gelatinilyticus TaxID=2931975 RepID=UPI001FF3E213|nr:hypothetical protein [Halosolutus gelatinilyticus]
MREHVPRGADDPAAPVRPEAEADAADAFAERARAEHGDAIRDLVAFGDSVQGERNIHAEAEVLVILEAADEVRERQLERLAETVGIERGVVVSVYVLPADRVDAHDEHPLLQRAFAEGQSYV